MKISSLSRLFCVALPAVIVASSVGQVFLYDSQAATHLTTPQTIDPATTRLILAQRLDLSQFHTISAADEQSVRQVNDFGGRTQQLFGGERYDEGKSSILIVVEGVQDPLVPALTEFASFSVSPAPHSSDSFQLFSTFSSEAAQIPNTSGPDTSVLRILAPLSNIEENTLKSYNNGRSLLYVKSIGERASLDRTEQLQSLTSVITNLYNVAKDGQLSLSIMFLPPKHLCSKQSSNAYGIVKRAANAARAEPEKLLSEAVPAAIAAKASSTSQAPTKSVILSGPIATCFNSQTSCEKGTNNCTGHGTCIRKWSGPAQDGKKSDCYGCMCSIPEVVKHKDGSIKTTQFGGGACHKKDIVTPFWLLVGTSVFLVLLVAWGVGLLYSMGSEELPSVIGAGVSGAVRK